MELAFGLNDVNLWLAMLSIILLTTSAILNTRYGKTGLIINKNRLRKVALIISFLFSVTAAIRIYEFFIYP